MQEQSAESTERPQEDSTETMASPTTPEQLLARLDALGIAYGLYHHPAAFTVAESGHLKGQIPGLHCRNLFLADKKKVMYLVVAANETMIDLKMLAPLIGAGRLSFGSAERLWRVLGVRPGSVCPYALINDQERAVTVILDKTMMVADLVNYHPLDNTMTIGVRPDDLVKFLVACGHEPRIVDLAPAAPDENCKERD